MFLRRGGLELLCDSKKIHNVNVEQQNEEDKVAHDFKNYCTMIYYIWNVLLCLTFSLNSFILLSWLWKICFLGCGPTWLRRGLKCSWKEILCKFDDINTSEIFIDIDWSGSSLMPIKRYSVDKINWEEIMLKLINLRLAITEVPSACNVEYYHYIFAELR